MQTSQTMQQPSFWKTSVAGAGIALMSLCLAAPVSAQDPDQEQGFAEQLGEELDQGLNQLSEEFRQGWASLRQAVNRMGVQGRVYSRLRWDKAIATAEIDVDVEQEGVVTLSGALDSAQAKQKAVELARDTVGVRRVIDRLSVQSAAEATADGARP